MEPATSIIAKFGGPKRVSEITGKSVSRVYRWTYPADRDGTGGVIPHDDAIKLLAEAAARGIALDAAEFFAKPAEASA